MLSLHLSENSVSAIALDERLPSARHRAHLAGCAACRARISEWREYRSALRLPSGDASTDGLLERIQDRIAQGERVLLPVSPPLVAKPQFHLIVWRQVAATALVLALGAGLLLRRGPNLNAAGASGELRFDPSAPRAGDLIHVEYRAPTQMSEDAVLALRGRYRGRLDRAYAYGTRQVQVAMMRRDPDGLYRATFRLPDSALYGAFAIEDTAGSRVDSRQSRLWELLVHDSTGQPLFDALGQRENDLMGRDMRLAFATARQRASLYPDRPDAWGQVRFHEQLNYGALADTLLPQHRARLERLNAGWQEATVVPFAVVDGMLAYSREVAESDTALQRAVRAHWTPIRQGLIAKAAGSPDVIRERWWQLDSRSRTSLHSQNRHSAQLLLTAVEEYWRGEGRQSADGAEVGYQIARRAGDSSDVLLRWVDRFAKVFPEAAEGIYQRLAAYPALRAAAIGRLSALSLSLMRPDDARRPLELTRSEAGARDSARARSVFGILGSMYLTLGDTQAARIAFERATTAGWDVALFHKIGSAQLVAGDTAEAVMSFARISTDPSTAGVRRDSLAAFATHAVGSARWAEMLSVARATMDARLMTHAIHQRVAGQVTLTRDDGDTLSFQRLTNGRLAVIAIWTTCCGASDLQLRALDTLATRLGSIGAVLVAITDDHRSSATIAFARRRAHIVPLYFDAGGAARVALRSWSLPEYIILDADGVIRFRHSALSLVLAQAAALQHATR